jgi:hypothetical protein
MMVAADGPDSGGGTISGTVSGELREVMPMVEIVLLNEAGDVLAYTRTDENGLFSFASIAYGTYFIHTEVPGITATPISVTLHEQEPAQDISIIIRDGEAVLSVDEYASAFVQNISDLFPNPVQDITSLEVDMKKPSVMTVVVRNGLGTEISRFKTQLSRGVHRVDLDTHKMAEGIYFVDILAEDGSRTIRKMVKLR